MNRRKFLGRLGLGAAASLVPAAVISEIVKTEGVSEVINPPIIEKNFYDCRASEIRLVKAGDEYLWYNTEMVETERRFMDNLERQWFEHCYNKKLT